MYLFGGAADVACHAQPCGRAAMAYKVVDETVVAIGRLYENLRLVFLVGTLLYLPYFAPAFIAVDGQVTYKGKTLSVESASHQRQQYRRRAYERYYRQAFALGDCHKVGTRVGTGGAGRGREGNPGGPRAPRRQGCGNLLGAGGWLPGGG